MRKRIFGILFLLSTVTHADTIGGMMDLSLDYIHPVATSDYHTNTNVKLAGGIGLLPYNYIGLSMGIPLTHILFEGDAALEKEFTYSWNGSVFMRQYLPLYHDNVDLYVEGGLVGAVLERDDCSRIVTNEHGYSECYRDIDTIGGQSLALGAGFKLDKELKLGFKLERQKFDDLSVNVFSLNFYMRR